MQGTENDVERRVAPRQKSFLRGFVYFDRLRGVMRCLVRDLSDEGARIILSQTAIISRRCPTPHPAAGETRRAHVEWRRSDEIGLAFTDTAATPASPDGDLGKRVAQLESQVAELQRTVKRFKREASSERPEVARLNSRLPE